MGRFYNQKITRTFLSRFKGKRRTIKFASQVIYIWKEGMSISKLFKSTLSLTTSAVKWALWSWTLATNERSCRDSHTALAVLTSKKRVWLWFCRAAPSIHSFTISAKAHYAHGNTLLKPFLLTRLSWSQLNFALRILVVKNALLCQTIGGGGLGTALRHFVQYRRLRLCTLIIYSLAYVRGTHSL